MSGLFQRSGIACLAGPSDVGKSMLLRMLLISIVTRQKEFLGFDLTPTHFSGIFVSTEDQENETAFLLRKQSADHKPEALRSLQFLFEADELISKLDFMLSEQPADTVVIDCFADAFGNDLIDTHKIRSFLHPFQKLASKFNTLIFFLHHTGKRTEKIAPSKNNLLAGQGLEAKMRAVFELRADPTLPNRRHLCVVKGNYLPSKMKQESIVLEYNEETFRFEATGERVPFEMLGKSSDDEGKAKYETAKELKSQGLSYQAIANQLGYSNKSAITKLFDKAAKREWDK